MLELAYLAVDVADPDAMTRVLADVVGLMPAETTTAAQATWRNDDRVHRLIVNRGDADDVTAVGIAYPDDEALASAIDRLRALGYEPQPSDQHERTARRVEQMWRIVAPWGVTFELVTGLAAATAAVSTPLIPSGFVTAGMGFGHCVFYVPDLDDAQRFVADGLGMRRSDSLKFEPAPGIVVNGGFYHGNPRHHTIALICPPGPPPFKLHHIMVEVNEQDDVGHAFDRAFTAGLPLPSGIGRHPNDQVVSFYLQTPACFQIEIGVGGRLVGDDWDDDRVYDAISDWGHQPVSRT